ncbi:unnamed protein product [Lymnaea stagnalis]|uniref:G-protein coupled receptors family 1 profile domain-containing protein n=1 Tax=Lymnaea stagnalis TaxID=6523 RepID=A0AAV2ILA1_LYMST
MPTEIYLMAQFFYFPNAVYCSTSRFITYFINNATSAVFLFIAIDRYFRICRPYSWSFSIARAKMACAASVCIGAIVSWPALAFYGNKTVTFQADADVPLNVTGVLCNVRNGYENSLGPDVFFNYLWCAFITCAIILIVLYSFIGRSILRRRRKKKLRMKQQAGGSPPDRQVNVSPGEPGHVGIQPLGAHHGGCVPSNTPDAARGNGLLVGETIDASHLIPLDVCEEHDDTEGPAVPMQQRCELVECGDVPECSQHFSEHGVVQIAGGHDKYDVDEGRRPLIDLRQVPGVEWDVLLKDRHDYQTRDLGGQDEDSQTVLLERDVENCVSSKTLDVPENRLEDLCFPNSDLSAHHIADNVNRRSNALSGSQPVNQSLNDNLPGLGDDFKHNSEDTPGVREAVHLNSQQQTRPVSGLGIPDSPLWVTSRTSHEAAAAATAEDATAKSVNGNCLPAHAWKARIPKSTLMLFAITLVFVVSFLPFLVVISIRQQRGPEFYQRLSAAEEILVHIFSRSYLVNNCANPIVYGLCNVQFRRQVKQLFAEAGRLCRLNGGKDMEGHKTT